MDDIVQLVSGGGIRDPRTRHSFSPIFVIGGGGCVECRGVLNPFLAHLVVCLNCRCCAHRRCIKLAGSRCSADLTRSFTVSTPLAPQSPTSPSPPPPPSISPVLSLSPSLALRDVGKKLRGLVDKVRSHLNLPSPSADAGTSVVPTRSIWEETVLELCAARARAPNAEALEEEERAVSLELEAVRDEQLPGMIQSRVLSPSESLGGRGIAKLQGKYMSFQCNSEPFDDDWHDNHSKVLIKEARACLDAALVMTLTMLPSRVLDSPTLLADVTNLVDAFVLGYAEKAMYQRVMHLCTLRSTSRRYRLDQGKLAAHLESSRLADASLSPSSPLPSPGFDAKLATFHLEQVSSLVTARDKASSLVRALQCVGSDSQGGDVDAENLLRRFTHLLLGGLVTCDELAETLRYWVSETIFLSELQHRDQSEEGGGCEFYGIREYATTVLETAVLYFVCPDDNN